MSNCGTDSCKGLAYAGPQRHTISPKTDKCFIIKVGNLAKVLEEQIWKILTRLEI